MNSRPALALITIVVMSGHCLALTPPLEPHTHSIKSDNGLFYAWVDVRTGTVTIKQVRRWQLETCEGKRLQVNAETDEIRSTK